MQRIFVIGKAGMLSKSLTISHCCHGKNNGLTSLSDNYVRQILYRLHRHPFQ